MRTCRKNLRRGFHLVLKCAHIYVTFHLLPTTVSLSSLPLSLLFCSVQTNLSDIILDSIFSFLLVTFQKCNSIWTFHRVNSFLQRSYLPSFLHLWTEVLIKYRNQTLSRLRLSSLCQLIPLCACWPGQCCRTVCSTYGALKSLPKVRLICMITSFVNSTISISFMKPISVTSILFDIPSRPELDKKITLTLTTLFFN